MNAPHHSSPSTGPVRVNCPVCHKPVYSRGDIHPQCAVRRVDGIEQLRLKKMKADEAAGA